MTRSNMQHGVQRPRPRSIMLPLITLAALIPVAAVMTLILIGAIQDGGYG